MKRLIFSFYFFFLLLFSWFSYLFVDPNLIYLKNIYIGFALTNRGVVSFIYCLFIFIFFSFYFYFLKLVRNKNLSVKEIILLISGTFVFLFFSYPAMLSYDIFNYIATAKVTFFYQENPYLIMPIDFKNDPLLLFMHAANKTALYAPFWIFLTGVPYLLGFGSFVLTMFNFKLLISIFYLLTAFLVWKISKNLYSVAIFALNPLVIIETLTSAHNDIVMLFLAILAFWFILDKSILKGKIVFLLSILIKYATAFLIPVFGYAALSSFKKRVIEKSTIWYICALSMFVIFVLSQFREEIYPWYGIWFLIFIALIPKKQFIVFSSIALSFGLMFRYVPFMYLGTHFGVTPVIKIVLTIAPVIFFLFFFLFKKKSFKK